MRFVMSRSAPMSVAGMPRPRSAAATALAAAVLLAAHGPARAVESAAVAVQWGDALVAGAQALATAMLPLAITAATAAAARIAGPLRFLVTASLVDRLVRNATAYALNAVAGAVAGRTLTVPLGSAVIARAVQRALDQAPAWLIRAAGGPQGLAEKVFRSLPLEEAATAANTLAPVLPAPRAKPPRPA